MVRVKKTLENYNQTSLEWREKLQPLFEEKNTKRKAIKELFGEDPKEIKIQSKSMRTKLNEKWKEENQELITKYQALSKQKNLDDASYETILEELQKLNPDIEEDDILEMIVAATKFKEAFKNKLLEKQNMTEKDKEGMKKSIKYLENNNMLTKENLISLEAINYTNEYIEVWWVMRSREDITSKTNGKNIYQYGYATYFKQTPEIIKEQNKLLAKQNMKIPLDTDYKRSAEALPGEWLESFYKWGNILSFITDMSMSGYCRIDGSSGDVSFKEEGSSGFRLSASRNHRLDNPISYMFNQDGGHIDSGTWNFAFPMRPIFN